MKITPADGSPAQVVVITPAVYAPDKSGLTEWDSGYRQGVIDLQPYAGKEIKLTFEWLYPHIHGGLSINFLDNILVSIVKYDLWLPVMK